MPEISRSIVLDAPVDKLWEQMSDLESQAGWLTTHTSFKGDVPKGDDLKPGATYSEVITLMGMANTVEWTVLEAAAPAEVLATKKGAFKVSGAGMAGVQVAIEIAVDGTAGDTTTVDLWAEFEGQMIVGAIGVAIEQSMGDELDASLANLQKSLSE